MSSAASSPRPRPQRDEQVGPPEADHVREGLAGVAVARRAAGSHALPPAMLEGETRALPLRLEAHLHLRALAGREVAAPELEHERSEERRVGKECQSTCR